MLAKNEAVYRESVSRERYAPMTAGTLGMPAQVGTCRGLGWREEIIRLLKDSLITELVSVLRYHHLSADSTVSPETGAEFLAHANQELIHAHRLAQRIVQFGGELEYSPNTLMQWGRTGHESDPDLQSMLETNLRSEFMAMLSYSRIMALIDEEDSVTRGLLEEVLNDEKKHAEELQGWLVN